MVVRRNGFRAVYITFIAPSKFYDIGLVYYDVLFSDVVPDFQPRIFVINMFAEFRSCQKFIFDLAVGKKVRYHRVGLVGKHFIGKFDHLLLCLHFPEIFV